jgi:hypothetical protein
MTISFSSEQYEALKAAGINHPAMTETGWSREKEATFETYHVDGEFIRAVHTFASKNSQVFNGVLQKLSLVRKAVDDPHAPVTRLDALAEAITQACMVQSATRWLFQHNNDIGIPLPYLTTGAVYTPSQKDVPASVRVNLVYWTKGEQRSTGITFHDNDLFNQEKQRRGMTVSSLLAQHGYGFVGEDIVQQYHQTLKQWEDYMAQVNTQFLLTTSWLPSNEDWRYTSTSREYLTGVSNFKVINDISAFRSKGESSRKMKLPNLRGGDEVDVFEIPIHPYLYVFNLETHDHMWVPCTWVSPYQYDEVLINRLIIPQYHKDLVNLLVSNPDTLKADFVKGKSGGTIIMAKGSPGTGKTMTAEAFSERAGVPLYRVQSDQLGVTAKALEGNLKEVFARAQRWGAILLIDEVDIYVYERGTNIEQNAIVGTLLRTLEYFNGVIFMTTNRDLLIDDAVLSRCSAVLTYSNPDREAAAQILKQFAGLFDLKVTAKETTQFLEILFEEFQSRPQSEKDADKRNDKNPISPRTIKNLLRLTKRLGNDTATTENLSYALQFLPG